jgi:hypothetical protein
LKIARAASISVLNLRKGPPATNRESPRGERGGERGLFRLLSGRALPFPSCGRLSENIPLSNPGREKEKVRFLRLGSLSPGIFCPKIASTVTIHCQKCSNFF